MGSFLFKLLAILWASPNSVLGLAVGCLGLLTGGSTQMRSGCIEFYGGSTTWLLARTPVKAIAMTLGHVILGQSSECLDLARRHELVHVRQYERWGPAFLPAYLFCSFWLWMNRREAYRNNPFEIEAYNESEPGAD